MRAASEFAGIGGFDLALERAGVEVVQQSEVDDRCADLLTRRFHRAQLDRDVRDVGALDVDLICGGFPCQDVSVAGARAGLAGERSGLFFELARVVGLSRPRWVIVENVPGLLSSNRGRDLGTVLGTLGDLGYGFAYRVLDAQFFGVPQRRRRVFIVGHLGDPRRAGQVLLEPEGGRWNPPARDEERAATPRGAGKRAPLLVETGAARALAARYGGAGPDLTDDAEGGHLVVAPFRKKRRPTADENDPETWEAAEYANTLDGGGNVTRTSHAVTYSIYHERGVRVVNEQGVRRLTPTECERLQGFPDGWTEGYPISTRYRMLGNAVAVPVVEWIVRRLLRVEEMTAS